MSDLTAGRFAKLVDRFVRDVDHLLQTNNEAVMDGDITAIPESEYDMGMGYQLLRRGVMATRRELRQKGGG